MSELELFNGRGEFVMPTEEQIAALDEPTRQRWAAVRDAAAEAKVVDDSLTAAQVRVGSLMDEVRDAESFVREHFPAQSREAAIRDYLATERMRRM